MANPIMKEIKEELKSNAKHIRKERLDMKDKQRKGLSADQYGLYLLSQDFRHRHIAYCEIRGRKREEIERVTDNPPNERVIQNIKSEYYTRLNAVEDAA